MLNLLGKKIYVYHNTKTGKGKLLWMPFGGRFSTCWGRRPLPYPASLRPFPGAWTCSASSSSVRRQPSAAVSSAISSSAISRRQPLRTVFIYGSSSAPWPSSRLSFAISISACGAASSASSPSGISSATPSVSVPLRSPGPSWAVSTIPTTGSWISPSAS